jgi:hypothetical protein
MELAMSAKEPYNYFLLLRALFRSIGGGSHDLLYQEFLPLLPSLLQGDTHTHTSFCVWTSYFCLFLLVISTFHLVLLLLNVFAYLWITCLCHSPLCLYAWTTQKLLNRFSWNLVLEVEITCWPFNFHQNPLRILDTCCDNLQAFVHASVMYLAKYLWEWRMFQTNL